jgi:hypothetical protein
MFRPRGMYLLIPCLLVGVPAFGTAQDWKPVDPAELALERPKVQADADAEAMLWEVRISDDVNNWGHLSTTLHHYVRMKIFTERGRERHATVDIPHVGGAEVRDVMARTIRPDGSIIELRSSDIHRRTIIKTGDLKIRTVSFAVPAIDRGVLVEYRWREVHRDSLAHNLALSFSRDIPVHVVRYFVRPLEIPGYTMRAWSFNGSFEPPARQRDGASMVQLTDVPAESTEEYAIPPLELRPWVFLAYTEAGRQPTFEQFARDFGRRLFEDYGSRSKPNEAIRKLAANAVASAASDAERVRALVRVARDRIRRLDVDTASPDDLRKARENRNAGDALGRGLGTAGDVVDLFLALANAAGFDARVGAVANRGEIFERSVRPHPYFLRGRVVAVRSGSDWLYVDPTNEYAANGELPWEYEGQRVLIADRRETLFGTTPAAPPSYSMKKRSGTFRLGEDGTLEGQARIEYTGHWAELFREQEDQDAPAEREKDLKDLITGRLPGAEVTDVRLDHVTDLDGPYANVYTVRVAGFAQRTGSRLFLQPAFFQKGVEALFNETGRTSAIYFPFPWMEEDVVTIELPPGFTVEPSALPKRMDVGAATYEARLDAAGSTVVFRRTLAMGLEGIFFDAATAYKPFRAFAQALHGADAFTLVLRREDGRQ